VESPSVDDLPPERGKGLESPPRYLWKSRKPRIRHFEILKLVVGYVRGRRNTPVTPLVKRVLLIKRFGFDLKLDS
jgi:hypothetical protein